MASLANYKNLLIRGVVCLAVVAGCVGYSFAVSAAAAEEQGATAAQQSGEPGPFTKDGTFEGSARAYGGMLDVRVTVENGYVTDVEILNHYDDSPYIEKATAGVIPEIYAEQTTYVDVVTNASYSSNGIRNAVKNALSKAGALPDGYDDVDEAVDYTEQIQKTLDSLVLEEVAGTSENAKREKAKSHSSGFAGGK